MRARIFTCLATVAVATVVAEEPKQNNELVVAQAAQAERQDQFRAPTDRDAAQQSSDREFYDRPLRSQQRADQFGAEVERPRQANRASRLLGMGVSNYQGEDLGEIRDIVVDFDTGRVSYLVLATDQPGTIRNKLVAVPISAFTPSREGDTLFLSSSRQRLQRAQGLSQTGWPDLKNPSWGGESAWDEARTTPRGGFERYGESDRPASQERYDRTEQYQSRAEFERDRPEPRESRLDRSGRGGDVGALRSTERGTSERRVFRGQIVMINPERRIMSVEDEFGRVRQFYVDERPVLTIKENRSPRLVDFKVGYGVSVGFREEADGDFVAETIILTTTPEVR